MQGFPPSGMDAAKKLAMLGKGKMPPASVRIAALRLLLFIAFLIAITIVEIVARGNAPI